MRKDPLLQIIIQSTALHFHIYNLIPISATDSMVYKALDTFSCECVTGGILVQHLVNNPLYYSVTTLAVLHKFAAHSTLLLFHRFCIIHCRLVEPFLAVCFEIAHLHFLLFNCTFSFLHGFHGADFVDSHLFVADLSLLLFNRLPCLLLCLFVPLLSVRDDLNAHLHLHLHLHLPLHLLFLNRLLFFLAIALRHSRH